MHEFPIILPQAQVDALVEASVPDHVVSYVELNQLQLFLGLPQTVRYDIVRDLLNDARSFGLETMGDLVSYVCAGLIYNSRLLKNPELVGLLDQVRRKGMTFDAALDQFP